MLDDRSDSIRVRQAKLADATIIVEYNLALALESENKILDRAVLAEGVNRALIVPGRCFYYVAEAGDRIAGQTMITFEWSDWRCGWIWWLQSVYVHPEFRRRGVFRRLFEHISSECRRRSDTCGLRLYVERHNHVAHQTYQRLGMKDAGYDLLEIDWSGRVGD